MNRLLRDGSWQLDKGALVTHNWWGGLGVVTRTRLTSRGALIGHFVGWIVIPNSPAEKSHVLDGPIYNVHPISAVEILALLKEEDSCSD